MISNFTVFEWINLDRFLGKTFETWLNVHNTKNYFEGVNDQTDDFKLSCCVEPKGKNNTTKAVTMHTK